MAFQSFETALVWRNTNLLALSRGAAYLGGRATAGRVPLDLEI
jgi:hypothetical protein